MKMAGGALKALPISTSELIFGSQKEEEQKPGDNGGIDEAENKNVIQPKEFFWDQFLKYLATAIALLTLLDFTLQFFRGAGGLLCYIPSDLLNNSDPTRDQVAFINTFCLLSLSWSEYFPVFIILQGILLVAPHYLWSALFGGQFDFFFDLVRQLDRLRDSNTGEYRPKNFDVVKKLEKEFPKAWKQFGIFQLYILKLLLQLIVALSSLILNPVLFPQSNFNFNFECPKDFENASAPMGWLLPSSVQCVYPSFRVFSRIQIANYLLLILAVIIAACGLFWCFKRHTNALGYKEIALFAFTSCLRPDEYVFKPFINSPFSPRIGNDLDFLLTRLFRADSGHGQVFKDLQIHKELKRLVGIDHELLHAYHDAIKDEKKKRALNKNAKNASGEEVWYRRLQDIQRVFFEAGFKQNPEGEVFKMLGKGHLGSVEVDPANSIRDYFFGFMQFGPQKNRIAYDISFGTIGYSLILARAFQEVISVNFHPFYRNEKQVCRKDTFYTNYTTITFQDDIFTQKTENITKSDEAIDEVLRGDYPYGSVEKTQFIVVGPFTDEAKKTTVNLHIERLNTGEYFEEGAALLTVRPLMIESKDVSQHFCKYEPPEELFELNEEVLKRLRADIPTELMHEGIKITCGHSECIFEFVVYKFIGKYPEHIPPHEIQQHLAELERDPSVVVRQQPPPNAIPVPPLPGVVPPPLSVMPPPLGMMPPHSGEPPNMGSIALILPASVFPQLDASDIEQFFAGNATIQLSARNQESPIRLVLKGGRSEDGHREAQSPASSIPIRSFQRHVSEPAPGPIAQNLNTYKNNRKQERLNESRRESEQRVQQKFTNTEATQRAMLEVAAEVIDGQSTVAYQTSNGATPVHNGTSPHTPSQTVPISQENACNEQDAYNLV